MCVCVCVCVCVVECGVCGCECGNVWLEMLECVAGSVGVYV